MSARKLTVTIDELIKEIKSSGLKIDEIDVENGVLVLRFSNARDASAAVEYALFRGYIGGVMSPVGEFSKYIVVIETK